MNTKQGLRPVVIVIILAILIGGGYLVSKKLQNESVTEEINSEVSGWKTYGEGSIEYPAGWTVEENISYDVDGKSVAYKGLMLVPSATKATASADKIFIGAPRVSVCGDVPDATKCRGGGKGSTFTVTFTRSTNPYVLQMYDTILQRWEKHVDWKNAQLYPGPQAKFEINYPSTWDLSELRFPCPGADNSTLGVISPARLGLPGYEKTSVAYLVQFCVSVNTSNIVVLYQGFIRAPLSRMPSEEDKIVLSSAKLENTEEYALAKSIIESQKLTHEPNRLNQ